MPDFEAVREREAEPSVNEYDEVLSRYRALQDRAANAQVVFRSKDTPYQKSRQGRIQFLLLGDREERTVAHWSIFSHDVHTTPDGITTSGQHRHQGGLALFALEGEGYTVVDGVRYDWKAGDLIMLPIKPDGCVHQHFSNKPGASARWVAFAPNVYGEVLGSMFEQVKEGSLVS